MTDLPDHDRDASRSTQRWAFGLAALVWVGLFVAAWRQPLRVDHVEPETLGYQLRVNHEPAARLQSLHGIGPALAEAIVAHRDRHGPFADVAALEQVPGIGPRKLARVTPWLRVD